MVSEIGQILCECLRTIYSCIERIMFKSIQTVPKSSLSYPQIMSTDGQELGTLHKITFNTCDR